jgi:hypothetical protein
MCDILPNLRCRDEPSVQEIFRKAGSGTAVPVQNEGDLNGRDMPRRGITRTQPSGMRIQILLGLQSMIVGLHVAEHWTLIRASRKTLIKEFQEGVRLM